MSSIVPENSSTQIKGSYVSAATQNNQKSIPHYEPVNRSLIGSQTNFIQTTKSFIKSTSPSASQIGVTSSISGIVLPKIVQPTSVNFQNAAISPVSIPSYVTSTFLKNSNGSSSKLTYNIASANNGQQTQSYQPVTVISQNQYVAPIIKVSSNNTSYIQNNFDVYSPNKIPTSSLAQSSNGQVGSVEKVNQKNTFLNFSGNNRLSNEQIIPNYSSISYGQVTSVRQNEDQVKRSNGNIQSSAIKVEQGEILGNQQLSHSYNNLNQTQGRLNANSVADRVSDKLIEEFQKLTEQNMKYFINNKQKWHEVEETLKGENENLKLRISMIQESRIQGNQSQADGGISQVLGYPFSLKNELDKDKYEERIRAIEYELERKNREADNFKVESERLQNEVSFAEEKNKRLAADNQALCDNALKSSFTDIQTVKTADKVDDIQLEEIKKQYEYIIMSQREQLNATIQHLKEDIEHLENNLVQEKFDKKRINGSLEQQQASLQQQQFLLNQSLQIEHARQIELIMKVEELENQNSKLKQQINASSNQQKDNEQSMTSNFSQKNDNQLREIVQQLETKNQQLLRDNVNLKEQVKIKTEEDKAERDMRMQNNVSQMDSILPENQIEELNETIKQLQYQLDVQTGQAATRSENIDINDRKILQTNQYEDNFVFQPSRQQVDRQVRQEREIKATKDYLEIQVDINDQGQIDLGNLSPLVSKQELFAKKNIQQKINGDDINQQVNIKQEKQITQDSQQSVVQTYQQQQGKVISYHQQNRIEVEVEKKLLEQQQEIENLKKQLVQFKNQEQKVGDHSQVNQQSNIQKDTQNNVSQAGIKDNLDYIKPQTYDHLLEVNTAVSGQDKQSDNKKDTEKDRNELIEQLQAALVQEKNSRQNNERYLREQIQQLQGQNQRSQISIQKGGVNKELLNNDGGEQQIGEQNIQVVSQEGELVREDNNKNINDQVNNVDDDQEEKTKQSKNINSKQIETKTQIVSDLENKIISLENSIAEYKSNEAERFAEANKKEVDGLNNEIKRLQDSLDDADKVKKGLHDQLFSFDEKEHLLHKQLQEAKDEIIKLNQENTFKEREGQRKHTLKSSQIKNEHDMEISKIKADLEQTQLEILRQKQQAEGAFKEQQKVLNSQIEVLQETIKERDIQAEGNGKKLLEKDQELERMKQRIEQMIQERQEILKLDQDSEKKSQQFKEILEKETKLKIEQIELQLKEKDKQQQETIQKLEVAQENLKKGQDKVKESESNIKSLQDEISKQQQDLEEQKSTFQVMITELQFEIKKQESALENERQEWSEQEHQLKSEMEKYQNQLVGINDNSLQKEKQMILYKKENIVLAEKVNQIEEELEKQTKEFKLKLEELEKQNQEKQEQLDEQQKLYEELKKEKENNDELGNEEIQKLKMNYEALLDSEKQAKEDVRKEYTQKVDDLKLKLARTDSQHRGIEEKLQKQIRKLEKEGETLKQLNEKKFQTMKAFHENNIKLEEEKLELLSVIEKKDQRLQEEANSAAQLLEARLADNVMLANAIESMKSEQQGSLQMIENYRRNEETYILELKAANQKNQQEKKSAEEEKKMLVDEYEGKIAQKDKDFQIALSSKEDTSTQVNELTQKLLENERTFRGKENALNQKVGELMSLNNDTEVKLKTLEEEKIKGETFLQEMIAKINNDLAEKNEKIKALAGQIDSLEKNAREKDQLFKNIENDNKEQSEKITKLSEKLLTLTEQLESVKAQKKEIEDKLSKKMKEREVEHSIVASDYDEKIKVYRSTIEHLQNSRLDASNMSQDLKLSQISKITDNHSENNNNSVDLADKYSANELSARLGGHPASASKISFTSQRSKEETRSMYKKLSVMSTATAAMMSAKYDYVSLKELAKSKDDNGDHNSQTSQVHSTGDNRLTKSEFIRK